MSNVNWIDALILAAWLILYLVTVTVAAARQESRMEDTKHHVPHWIVTGSPYAVGIGFALYFTEPWMSGDLLNAMLFAVTFVALTWVIVWSVRKQKTDS